VSAKTSQPLPLGEEVDWAPAQRPARHPLRGAYVLARPFLPDADPQPLYAASHPPEGDLATWTYLPDGPYESVQQLRSMLEWAGAWEDAVYFALAPLPEERPLGMAAYLRITPESGVIEIGHVWFGTGLMRTTAATEAIYLLVGNAFDELGYRRVEWKCNALNAASRKAAERFGFTFEGVFRKHQIVKGRNRDTAWFAITDDQWPAIRGGFQAWLAPENFDAQGRQRLSLGALIERSRLAH
jgi:RimJ/RimL family protein N-acetyltransferase